VVDGDLTRGTMSLPILRADDASDSILLYGTSLGRCAGKAAARRPISPQAGARRQGGGAVYVSSPLARPSYLPSPTVPE